MSSIQLRRLFSRTRSRFALMVTVVALAGAVVAHHTPIDMHGMTSMTCLAVLGAATLVTAAAPPGRRAPRTVGSYP